MLQIININKAKCVEAVECGKGNIGNEGQCEECGEEEYASFDKTTCVKADECGDGIR